jgi:hypothetical protein
MPEFVVYEVVREIRFHKWKREVVADSSDDALVTAMAGNASEPAHCGELGEPEEVHSGWTVRAKSPNSDDDLAWNDAYEECEQAPSQGSTDK